MSPFSRQPWKISTFLYLLLFVAVVVPIGFISAVLLQAYKQDLLQQTTERTQQTVRAIAYTAEQEIAKAVTFAAAVGMDQEVLGRATTIHRASDDSRQQVTSELLKTLDKYGLSMAGHVQAIQFVFKGGGTYSYLKDLKIPEASLRNASWYRKTRDDPDRVHFLGMQSDVLYGLTDNRSIAAAISPSLLQGMHEVEMLYVLFSRDAFESLLRQNPYSRSSPMAIVGRDGSMIASSSMTDGAKRPRELTARMFAGREGTYVDRPDRTGTLYAYASIGSSDWRVVYEIPYREVTANYEKIFRFAMGATVLIILLFLIIAFYFAHRITKPIQLLVIKMSRVVQGNLNAKIEAAGSREMVTIGQTFNHMMDQIKRLIREREEEEQAKHKAEFAALQAQINPHFLINTLNAIRLMALISKADNIHGMTHALIRLLSSSFNRGGSLTSIADEIENLCQYIYIMETRFGSKFEVRWDVEEETKRLYVLKLLLQPILENCIVHGLAGRNDGGIIHIAAQAEDRALAIAISDNGSGMTAEQIGAFERQSQTGAFSGMGIHNVHQRIQLHYGASYGLRIEPLAEGTAFRLRVPVLAHGDEAEQSAGHEHGAMAASPAPSASSVSPSGPPRQSFDAHPAARSAVSAAFQAPVKKDHADIKNDH
ncbi:sensor histidine kinase [Paenibacillus methanolicus]|uniref:histidine kinase n=1 Tax=Paenibacillus methanolicus TaxID=582686 RepID=A0A5S5C5X8_9BACL|nr:sensor histidine kinase [Paenibacillus methanolicus]TYP74841.1 two-component system sensor histidine kinase YesM [Paenibacillus methanolicus]